MAFQSAGLSLYQSTKPHSFLTRARDRYGSTKRQGILYTPGLTGNALSWRDGVEVADVWYAAAEYRFRLFSISEEIHWGNQTHMTKMDNAYGYITRHLGFRSRIHLFCASGGGAGTMNWALRNPAKVASICGVIPALDLQDIDDNDRTATIGLPDATYGPAVASGYGARPPDAWNPADNTTALRATGIPMMLFCGLVDPVCVYSVAQAFSTAVGATLITLPGGHSSVGMGASTVVDFYRSHASHP